MIEILQELDASGTLLRAALDRYLSACLAIQGCYKNINATDRLPREFSRRITDELPQASSYEAKIKEAKAAIRISRNSCTDIVPIHSLPNEILAQIFHLIHNGQLCASDSLQRISLNPVYIYSSVCSLWRRISISLGTLWSRIDLSLTQSSRQYLDRALGHAARASNTPLDVYIFDTFTTRDKPSGTTLTRMYMFLRSIAPRIRSLTLSLDLDDLNKPYSSVLGACFGSCTPGVLTRLVLNGQRVCRFLEAAEDPHTPPQIYGSQLMGVDVPKQVLENIWLHVMDLQSHHLCLPWTSKAYHGLTMLRLTGSGYNSCILKQELIGILKSSPQLRALRFGLQIADSHLTDDPVVPVHLECLEVLVWEHSFANPAHFFQLIAPGLKPLQVFLSNVTSISRGSISLDEMKKFFSRSNVTKLRLRGHPYDHFTPDLLNTLPPLEILALESGYTYSSLPGQENNSDESEPHSAYPSCFQALHLINCRTQLDFVLRIIQRHSVHTLMIDSFDSDFPSTIIAPAEMSVEVAIERLRAVCPAVNVFKRHEPSPLNWDNALAQLEFI